MMFETALGDPRAWPEPGEVWRHRMGQHYVVTQRSVHGETQEVLVVCRSCTPPYASVTYPLDHFLGAVTTEDGTPRFERVEELVS
jgi:hypothetical protein